MNIQHSSRNDAWRTPEYLVALITKVLGTIDLDPASDEAANKTVKASKFITQKEDALSINWPQNQSVYLNPPGGKIGNKSKVGLFWDKLTKQQVKHAIFACFSAEALQVTQQYDTAIMDFPVCIPSKRVRWVHPWDDKTAPSHSNAFVYIPGSIDNTSGFIEHFSKIGKIMLPTSYLS